MFYGLLEGNLDKILCSAQDLPLIGLNRRESYEQYCADLWIEEST